MRHRAHCGSMPAVKPLFPQPFQAGWEVVTLASSREGLVSGSLGGVFVSEQRVVPVSIGAARARLVNLVHDGGLGGAAEAAYWGGVDHLLRVGPLGDVPGLSRRVRVQFLEPVDRSDGMTVGMRWAVGGVTGGLFPVLDADIELAAEGEEDTRVRVTGVYRPPLGAVGAGLDRVLLHRVASATIGSLLTDVAQALAGTAPAAAEAGVPVRWETGPETAS